MIIDYNSCYDEEIKDLFVELQEYIVKLDKDGFNILTPDYREKYFNKTMEEIKTSNGKMFLYEENGKIIGLIVGLIREEIFEYDFHAPKRGEITELIVSKNCRAKGYGKMLINSMEKYFETQGCKNITLGVFGYNTHAIEFYGRNDYHMRFMDMTKTIN